MVLGAVDDKAEGWRLYKWSLGLKIAGEGLTEKWPVEDFVSAQLLSLVESQAVRKFVVIPDVADAQVATMVSPTLLIHDCILIC
jgi:ubiquitin-protein ligase E3 D